MKAMETIERRGPGGQSLYVTRRYGMLAQAMYSEVRSGGQTADGLRTRMLAAEMPEQDADRLFAVSMMGIAAGERADRWNPVADRKAEWDLARAVYGIETMWGLHGAPGHNNDD